MKKGLLILGFLVRVTGLDAQSPVKFSKIYGTNFCDAPCSVVTTAAGGYAMGGSTTAHEHNGNYLLVVTDAFGDTLWTREYDSGGMDLMYDMKRTADNGYVMIGVNQLPANSIGQILVIKTDVSGNPTWSKVIDGATFNHEYPADIIQTSDGGYAIAAADDTCSLILKLDPTGTLQWMNRYTAVSAFGSRLFALAETPNGDLIAAGTLFVSNSAKLLLMSVGQNGNLNWSKSVSGTDDYWPNSIVLHSNGFIYVSGTANLYSSGAEQIFVMQFNNAGALQFTMHYDVLQFPATSAALIETSTGDLCFAATSYSGPTIAVTFRIDQAGTTASSAVSFVPTNPVGERFADVVMTGDGGLAFLASPDTAFGVYDTATFHLIKVEADYSSPCQAGIYVTNTISKTCVAFPETMQVLSVGTSAAVPLTYAAGLYVIDVCNNVGIAENISEESATVYPNPAGSEFVIHSLTWTSPEKMFVLHNSLGQEVKRVALTKQDQVISCEELSEGIYFYSVLSEGKLIGKGKLVTE